MHEVSALATRWDIYSYMNGSLAFQAEHCQFRLESCQYLKCLDFVGVAIWNWFNLVSLFQFKLSIIPRIFQGWTFDFLTSNPYQKLYYFSTGAIIWPPCRKDNLVRTNCLPIWGKKMDWRLLQTTECKIINQTFSTYSGIICSLVHRVHVY